MLAVLCGSSDALDNRQLLTFGEVKKHFQGTGIVSPLDGVVQLHEKSSSKPQNSAPQTCQVSLRYQRKRDGCSSTANVLSPAAPVWCVAFGYCFSVKHYICCQGSLPCEQF